MLFWLKCNLQKHNHETVIFFHRNATDMLLLTDKPLSNWTLNVIYYMRLKSYYYKMYVTSTNILMFKISIAIVSIIISIIIITITVITSSIIIVFIKSAWRIFQIKQLSPAILVSHNFWRQKFAYIFVFTISLFKSYIMLWIKITWAFNKYWSVLKSGLFKRRSFDWYESNSKCIQIRIFTGKRLWWRPFKCSCWYEDLQLYENLTSLQTLSCETCEVLRNKIFKENWWPFAS